MLSAALAAAAIPAAAAVVPAEVIHDTLTLQIRAQQLKLKNGGITAVVRVEGTGTGIPLELKDPLAPLAPAEGLAEERPKAKAKKKPARRADEQLETLGSEGQKAAWDKTRK